MLNTRTKYFVSEELDKTAQSCLAMLLQSIADDAGAENKTKDVNP